MANTISSAGTFTVSINGSTSKFIGDLSLATITKTGSNSIGDIKNITSGSSWTALTTSSLTDMRYMYFSNEGTASIVVAGDSAGTKVLTTLQPNDHSQIAWSGAINLCPLWANVREATSTSVLYYILTES